MTGSRNKGMTWLFIGILLIAANLRAPITGVGSIVGMIKEDTGLSATVVGLLTTITLLAFAGISPLVPRLSRAIGIERSLFAGLVVLILGIAVRFGSSVWMLFVGTACIGIAIAVANVLIPTIIKRDYPERVGLMTGLYSVLMNLWAAIASGITVPLAVNAGMGWRGALSIWGVLAIVAMLVWLPQVRKSGAQQQARIASQGQSSLWRSKLAWSIALFMGFQSFLFYVNITWMPEIMHAQGMSSAAAGWMMTLLQMVSLPASFFVPLIAVRMHSQRKLMSWVAIGYAIGYVLVIIGGTLLTIVGVSLIGFMSGAGFSLSIAFFSLRTRNVDQAGRMSGMGQSIGYLIAAVGPMLFGLLHDLTKGWTVSYISLFIILGLFTTFGLAASRPLYVLPDPADAKQKSKLSVS